MVCLEFKKHMERVALITVESTFCLNNDRQDRPPILIIHPNLSVPIGGWKERTEPVTVLKPDGHEFEATAKISLSHFNIKNPDVSIDQRWRVTIIFLGKTSDDVPVGAQALGHPIPVAAMVASAM